MVLAVRCSRPPGPALAAALEGRAWRAEPDAWDLWLPVPKEPLTQALRDLMPPSAAAVVGAVPGAERLAGKRSLWATLVNAHGRAVANTIQPPGWLPDVLADATAFAAVPPGRFLVKDSLLQRRRGIHLAESWEEALDVAASLHKPLIQRLVPDVLAVSGHRISLRVYLLLVREPGVVAAFVHGWGAVVYARAQATEDAGADGWLATTSGNWLGPPGAPLELQGLFEHLRQQQQDPGSLASGIARGLRAAVSAAAPHLARDRTLAGQRCFELLGADFVPDQHGVPWLVEINRKPMMRPRVPSELAPRAGVWADALAGAGLGAGEGGSGFVPLGRWAVTPPAAG